jgi:hypothetical protein
MQRYLVDVARIGPPAHEDLARTQWDWRRRRIQESFKDPGFLTFDIRTPHT